MLLIKTSRERKRLARCDADKHFTNFSFNNFIKSAGAFFWFLGETDQKDARRDLFRTSVLFTDKGVRRLDILSKEREQKIENRDKEERP